VEAVVTVLQPIVLTIVLTLQIAMEAAMFPPAQTFIMGSLVELLEPVVTAVMPVLQTIVHPVVPIPRPLVMGHGRCGEADRKGGGDDGECKFTHFMVSLSFNQPTSAPVRLNGR
jgi:hypothetical protein